MKHKCVTGKTFRLPLFNTDEPSCIKTGVRHQVMTEYAPVRSEGLLNQTSGL